MTLRCIIAGAVTFVLALASTAFMLEVLARVVLWLAALR